MSGIEIGLQWTGFDSSIGTWIRRGVDILYRPLVPKLRRSRFHIGRSFSKAGKGPGVMVWLYALPGVLDMIGIVRIFSALTHVQKTSANKTDLSGTMLSQDWLLL